MNTLGWRGIAGLPNRRGTSKTSQGNKEIRDRGHKVGRKRGQKVGIAPVVGVGKEVGKVDMDVGIGRNKGVAAGKVKSLKMLAEVAAIAVVSTRLPLPTM